MSRCGWQALIAASALALVTGCAKHDGTPGSADGGSAANACVPTRDYFAHDVWASFMSTTCFKCHAPDGVAVLTNGAKFVLQPPTYPGFLDANLANLQEISKIDYEGTSELLLKPLGQMMHGGGQVLQENSPQYAALKELVKRLQQGDSCPEKPAQVSLSGVDQLDPASTFRKAALALGGRLPTDAENMQLASGGEAALDSALDTLMKEDAFYVRLREAFNDILLTDKYQWAGRGWPIALYTVKSADYPGATTFTQQWETDNWKSLTADQKQALNDSIGREPLNLIAYVVAQERPFTEILTANYALVDDWSAQVYGVKDGKTGVREAQVTNGLGTAIPHAGILSTPMFVNRWPTTPTNRSRGRARFLLKNFLATDILKIADRPIDVATVTKVDNPTMNADTCKVCHRVIDPIAGGFRGWDESNYEHFDPNAQWHSDMVLPGFGDLQLPPEKYGSAVQWLAQQMAQDPRFDIAAAQLAYKMMTGRDPLGYPTASDTTFDADLQAWEAQDAFFRSAIAQYVAKNRNFKVLVKAMVESPYYRATGAKGLAADRLPQVDSFGTSRLLTPEMLNRKIIATTGVHWRMLWGWDQTLDWLLDPGTMQMYGGIDSDAITSRITQMSSLMASLAQRMANEHSCVAVPYDFSLPQEQRVLFPKVRTIDIPESAGYPVDGSIHAIKDNIRYLHQRLLGEALDENDPEIQATYQLFLDTWHEGTAMGGPATQSMPWPCGIDPTSGQALPSALRQDAQYTVRAWMAVVNYLLLDERFLYE